VDPKAALEALEARLSGLESDDLAVCDQIGAVDR
jgi:hypothetical protein